MAEHSCITLVPNDPGDEHSEGGHSTPVGDVIASSLVPPLVDGIIKVPKGGVHVSKAKFFNDNPP